MFSAISEMIEEDGKLIKNLEYKVKILTEALEEIKDMTICNIRDEPHEVKKVVRKALDQVFS